ncbi:MAG: S9 family peptidase [Colwellia sp.]|nr:S9 family peptidase [Colwellia sp.]
MQRNNVTISAVLIATGLLVVGCGSTDNSKTVNQTQSNQTLSKIDYQRAEKQLRANTSKLVTGTVQQAKWLDDNRLSYKVPTSTGHQFIIANVATKKKQPAFDHEAIAKVLSSDDHQYQGEKLPFTRYKFNDDYSAITFKINKDSYNCELSLNQCVLEPDKTQYKGEIASPDGMQAAFIREFNLWVRDTQTLLETQLTTDGVENFGYATNNAGWTRGKYPVLLWSPDSRKITTFQHDSRKVGDMHLVSTKVGHPELDSWKYPLPGDEHVFSLHRVIIDVAKKKIVRLKMAPDEQRSTITDHIYRGGKFLDVEWSQNSQSLAFVSVSRDHKEATLRIANARTGDVKTIMNEKVRSFFESGKGKVNWHYLPESNEILWFSQRSDWGHLYLYDLTTAKLKQTITQGDWNVLQVLNVDKTNRTLYFTGAGREAGDPYFQYFYSVNFDGSNLTLLTPENANHSITLSDNGGYFLDRFSTPSKPEISQIKNSDGELTIKLEKADISQLIANGWVAPESFVVKDRDGNFELHGLMYKPKNFDANKSYPIVNYLYPGPQTGSIGSRSFVASRGDKQAMAELGFILIEIDALGTPMRSKSFHEFYYGNMGDSGVPDQKSAIEQLAKKYSWLDTDRVGIWGHSGGGFASTNAILTYPEFYKVAVSGAGNHDNRTYADSWGEKWQGLLVTNEDGTTNYDNQANQLLVENLTGKLLLAHGTLDDNVPPNNTLVVVDALIKANKDFDLLMLPNRRHGFAREDYMMRKRWDYFVEHLMGATPPKEFVFGEQKSD